MEVVQLLKRGKVDNKKPFVIMILLLAAFSFPSFIFAETVILKSGKTIEGKIIEHTDNHIKIETADGQPLFLYKDTIYAIKNSNGVPNPTSLRSNFRTGLLDYPNKGYMLFLPDEISSSSPILICLPGWGVKTKYEINKWAFIAGKKGFVVLSLDVDYDRIGSFSDVEALYSRISDILDSLVKEYHISKDRLYLVGTSAGGMMSIALTLHYPEKFVAIGVVSGGRLGFGAQEELGNARGSHFYMVHGESDEKIPLEEFQSSKKQLEQNGAIIEYSIIPGGKHKLNSSAYKEVVNWLSVLE